MQLLAIHEEEHGKALELATWPQPARDVLSYRMNLPAAGPYALSVFDAQGRALSSEERVAFRAGEMTGRLDCSGWAVGAHFLVIEQGGLRRAVPVLITGE